MRVSSIDGVMSTEVKEGVELPKFIRTLTIETAEEEQQVRLFLTGGLKFDESGCRALGRDFGSNALSQSSDMSNGSYALGVVLDSNQASHLDGKLKIIEALTLALNYGDNIGSINRDLLSLKLKSVIDDL
ncbi:MAG: hypothetical protein ACN6OV_00620 [Acinetobacter sp.]|uniref:hypothetical protein n=1 Tax=Acinetobacter sp. TaxID=472 RepID=UPI003D03B40E